MDRQKFPYMTELVIRFSEPSELFSSVNDSYTVGKQITHTKHFNASWEQLGRLKKLIENFEKEQQLKQNKRG